VERELPLERRGETPRLPGRERLPGEIVWSERGKVPPGSVTYADGRLVAFAEMDGTVQLIEASTAGLAIAGRFKIPQQSKSRKPGGHIWTPPVVSGGRLFLRDQELLFCYDVKRK
jgi:hypothetical protein